MEELQTIKRELPDNLEELARFALIGREKLNSVKAEIRAIEKVGLAKEVHEQKLVEAQEIAEAVLDAEVKIGELTAKIEEASHDRGNQYTGGKSTALSNSQTKNGALQEIGIPQHTAERFERLAKHPDTVEKAKADARSEGRIVTRQDVLNRIVTPKPKSNPIKEVVENAQKEHAAFRESKVVNFDDIEKDKLNVEITTNETYLKILKGARAASDLCLLNIKDVRELAKRLPEDEKDRLQNSLMLAHKTISKIIADLED